jgi:argininosuccinate lyase
MRFAPEYVRCVLRENFEDARALFLDSLLAIHRAHLVMLAERGIVSAADARALRDGLDAIDPARVRRAVFDGSCEDLFFHVDRLLAGHCGEDAAGRLHTARSRNDIDMTMYRMEQRRGVLAVLHASVALRETLIGLAGKHRETILALHTHAQPAQPSTVAHYLLAVIEQLERDAARLLAAFDVTNRNPLGACAITGTGFPVDRDLTSRLLGFSGPTGNTYGSIATADYLLQNVTAAATLLTGLGRFIQDMLLWCTAEFAYMRLGDGFVQGSSIMPQKRNPVALEHARAISSRALGEAIGIVVAVHNTPFGDVVDTEDDLQPLVERMFHDATRAIDLASAAMAGAEFDAASLERRAAEGWITITELADMLVRDHGLSFGAAHGVARRVVEAKGSDPAASLSRTVAEATAALPGGPVRSEESALEASLNPRHFVDIRRTHGGPAPEETARALAASRSALDADVAWLAATRTALESAAGELTRRSAAL